MEPVDFVMQPAGKLRMRVVNQQGQPIPKARVFFQKWRGEYAYFAFDHVNQYANSQGVWEWNGAPADAFEADISGNSLSYMQLGSRLLKARDEEYVFQLPPALVVTGRVVDAKTKAPIKSFDVLPGSRWTNGELNWFQNDRFQAHDGTFEMRRVHDRPAYVVRIEAHGYLPADSPDIKSDQGNVAIDFELERGKDITATVLTPAGVPATGARVALGIPGAQIQVRNGQFDANGTYADRVETNAKGQFRFPPQVGAYQLVIMHADGYAHVKIDEGPPPQEIPLIAWARVEGTFRVGQKIGANVPIAIDTNALRENSPKGPNIFANFTKCDRHRRPLCVRARAGGAGADRAEHHDDDRRRRHGGDQQCDGARGLRRRRDDALGAGRKGPSRDRPARAEGRRQASELGLCDGSCERLCRATAVAGENHSGRAAQK